MSTISDMANSLFANADLRALFARIDANFENITARITALEGANADLQSKNDNLSVSLNDLHVSFTNYVINGALPLAEWMPDYAYAASSQVFVAGALYRCLRLHISGIFAVDLAAGCWRLIDTVSVYQFQRALVAQGLFLQVQATISDDPTNYAALQWHRGETIQFSAVDPLCAEVQAALGYSTTQMAALFSLAASVPIAAYATSTAIDLDPGTV